MPVQLEKLSGSNAVEHIQLLEKELISLAHYDARLCRAERQTDDKRQLAFLTKERRIADQRIRYALAEIKALDEAYLRQNEDLSNLASWYEPSPRPAVRFFGIEIVPA